MTPPSRSEEAGGPSRSEEAGGGSSDDGPVVTVFRSRLRPESEDEYRPMAQEMEVLARQMPGFVDFATYEHADGERVSVITFATRRDHDAWRDHPRHRHAQRLGRERFYESYFIQVCGDVLERRFQR